MINKSMFKEAYELAIALRYKEVFEARSVDKARLALIKQIIMSKSPPTTKDYRDFYKQDLASLKEFYSNLEEIKDRAAVNRLEGLNPAARTSWLGWHKTWRTMADNLLGIEQARRNMINDNFREKDAELVKTVCDWYLDNKEKHMKLFEKVYDREKVKRKIVEIIFENWDHISVFT